MSSKSETKLDKILMWVKNHTIFSIIIFVSMAVIGVGQFFDALTKIRKFFSSSPSPTPSMMITPTLQPSQNPTSLVHEEKIIYEVILMLPSRMSGAEILVDGEPAKIIKQTHTVVKIQVEEKQDNYQFTAKKDEDTCTKQQLIREDNTKVFICQ